MMADTDSKKKELFDTIKKLSDEGKLSEADFAEIRLRAHLSCWCAAATFHSYQYVYNPFNLLGNLCRALSNQNPTIEEVGVTRDMVKYASRALSDMAIIGDVKRGEGIIKDLHADINYLDKEGHTPLYYAIRSQQLPMAEMLLSKGADATLTSKDSITPVVYAAGSGYTPALDLFAKYHVDFNKPKKYRVWNKYHLGYKVWHLYPLAVAVGYQQPESCRKLLEYGASLDVEFKDKLTVREAVIQCDKNGIIPETTAVFKEVLNLPHKVSSSIPQLPPPQNDHVRE